MADDAEPIAYSGLTQGVPMLSQTGRQFGTVERVLEIPEHDLFDGIVVATPDGARFVDADQVAEVTTAYVRCTITDEQAADLPEPSGSPSYRADATADVGDSLGARLGRLFRRGRWKSDR